VLTVDRAVENIGFGWFQVKLSLFTGLVWVGDQFSLLLFCESCSGDRIQPVDSIFASII